MCSEPTSSSPAPDSSQGKSLHTNQRDYMKSLLSEREDFLLIGLTGRVGSGCSAAADIFQMNVSQMNMPSICPGDLGLSSDDQRDKRILLRYFDSHWLPFDSIQVRSVILSFLLTDFPAFAETYFSLVSRFSSSDEFLQELSIRMEEELKLDTESRFQTPDLKNAYRILHRCKYKSLSDFSAYLQSPVSSDISPLLSQLEKWYENRSGLSSDLSHRDYFAALDQLLYALSARTAYDFLRGQKPLWSSLKDLGQDLVVEWIEPDPAPESETESETESKTESETTSRAEARFRNFRRFVFVHDLLPALSKALHTTLAQPHSTVFTELFQKFGNCIRCFGSIQYASDPSVPPEGCDVFAIPRKINQFISVLRHPLNRRVHRPTRVVIDSIKNNFEATYLRDRYSAFYLFAISADESVRLTRLTRSPRHLNLEQIHHIDWNEYSSIGRTLFSSKSLSNDEERNFVNKVQNEKDPLFDPVRQQAYVQGTHQFLLQDVESCIQNADVFISNSEDHSNSSLSLKWPIVRNVCLILYPGLVQPTPLERCMQIAFTAKANSGCLSRQVGAVVTDPNYQILSIGWNDVPCGDISCSRKNLQDLYNCQDQAAYTEYELTDPGFRKRLEQFKPYLQNLGSRLNGLPLRYCFKDIHADEKNPMRSRAMHGEEKALAACGSACEGGCLFTTSSPCEMCCKNAKDHKIRRIYYIEPYPGISHGQYTNSGDISNRAQHILFTGAIGRAYSQMYTPLLPHKDILELLGIPSKPASHQP